MTDSDLHVLYTEWAAWCRSKRLYAPSPNPQSVIGCLVKPPSERTGDGKLDPQIAALHLAILGADEENRGIVTCYYLRGQIVSKYRRGGLPVKTIAHLMGVSRKTFYVRLSEARKAIFGRIRSDELAVAE